MCRRLLSGWTIKPFMNWKQSLNESRKAYMLDKFQACRDFGIPKKLYSDKTANSLTAAICDFLKFNNHYANRINSTGMPRNINGRMVWTKGNSNKGTADISCIIEGKAVSIEVKVGRDVMSEAQHRERERITAAGGTYIVARDMEGFLKWYNEFTDTNQTLNNPNAFT